MSRDETDAIPSSPASGLAGPERYSCALHEVSNALTVVLGWLELAQKAPTASEAEEAIRVALEHARRGRSMARRAIGDDVGSDRPRRSAATVGEFVVISLRPEARARGVHVELEVGPGADAAIDHDDHVLQILTNLLLNALAFSPPDTRVVLSVEREGDVLRFSVTDEGPGIPSPRHASLFSAPESTRPGGVGIGLPHSRGLARAAGGDLRLVATDRGARFELTWPVFCGTGVRPSAPAAAAAGLDTARLLIIDDDVAICSLLELSLEARGAEVITVSDAEQLEVVLSGRPLVDVVLLDLSPVEGKLAFVLDQFDELLPGASIVLMSGQPGGVPPEAEARFAAWVRKPFDLEQLIATVAGLLDQEQPVPG